MWMNIPIGADRSLAFEPTVAKPGDYVILRAEMNIVTAFSACPQDVLPIDGAACKPAEVHLQVLC